MPDAIAIQIAKAVVHDLNEHAFSESFTAVRKYYAVEDLKNMSDLHVTIVPKAHAQGIVGRNQVDELYAVDVAVQKKIEVNDLDVGDPLMLLVEEIKDFLKFRKLADYVAASWVKTENEPLYSYEHMRDFRQFTSVVTVTYKLIR